MPTLVTIIPFTDLQASLRAKMAAGRKQAEAAIPGVPNLKLLGYVTECWVWLLRFYFLDPRTNKRKRDSYVLGNAATMSFAEAVVAASAFMRRINEGWHPNDQSITVAQFWDQYFVLWAKANKASWKDDVSRFNHHVREWIGQMAFQHVRMLDLQHVVDALPEHLSVATANKVVALLKALCREAAARGFIEGNPAAALRFRREQNERRRVVRDAEFAPLFRALEAEKNPLLKLLVLFLLAVGARLSEALTCRWSAVELDSPTPTVTFFKTKNGKARSVPLSPEAVAVCQELAALRRNEFVFPGRYGGHMTRPGRAFQRVLDAAGIEGLWLHDLRRTFGSLACNAGVPIYDISKLLGHSSIQVTANRYLVIKDERLHSACQTVGKLLTAAAAPKQEA